MQCCGSGTRRWAPQDVKVLLWPQVNRSSGWMDFLPVQELQPERNCGLWILFCFYKKAAGLQLLLVSI